MSGLLTSLRATTNTLGTISRALDVVQNNINNVGTAGYARQVMDSVSLSFDAERGMPGGVAAGPMIDTRDRYAEESVRGRQSDSGFASTQLRERQAIESAFPLREPGPGASWDRLAQSFSRWSVAPNDRGARQQVLDQAKAFGSSVRAAAHSLQAQRAEVDRRAADGIAQVNGLANRLRALNVAARNTPGGLDAGLQAQQATILEELSGWVDVSVVPQSDGTASISLRSGTPLVVGDQHFALSAEPSAATLELESTSGQDTGPPVSGRLGALFAARNEEIPEALNGLNRWARGVADAVNTQLATGVDPAGNPNPLPLFRYDASLGEAATLAVNDLDPMTLPGSAPGQPGDNTVVLELARLGTQPLAALDGQTGTTAYGALASGAGRAVEEARQSEEMSQDSLAQAQGLRDAISGVDLNREASRLLELQRSFEANAKVISVLDELTQSVINILR